MSDQAATPHRPARSRPATAAVLAAALGMAAPAVGGVWACSKESALPAGRITRRVEIMLGHLPGDAWAVAGINAARLRQVPVLRGLLDRLPGLPPEIADACGFEELGGIDLAVATLGSNRDRDSVFVALQGGFTRQEVERCIFRLSKTTGEPISVAHQELLTIYDVQAGSGKSYVYWPTADFVILSPRSPSSPTALGRLIGAAGVSSNAELMSYVRRVRTDAAFWMAGPLPPDLQKQMAGFGTGVPALQGFTVTVDRADEGKGTRVDGQPFDAIGVLVRLRLGQAQEARAAAQAFREQKAGLARAVRDSRAPAIADKLEVTLSGEEVALRVSLTAAEAALLVDLLAGTSRLPRSAP